MWSIKKYIINKFTKKSNNKALYIKLNNDEKTILYQRIRSLRNQTERDIKLSYEEVFDLMKKMSILPESWTEHSTIHKFISRYETELIEKEDEFIKIIRSYFDKIKITDKDRMNIFWSCSTDEEKRYFFNEIAEYCMRDLGIDPSNITNFICNRFNKLGYLSSNTIREIMPNEYKNMIKSRSRKGKTFESMGKDTVAVKKFKNRAVSDQQNL